MEKKAIIRQATVDDAHAIYEINKEALGYDFPPERTRERLQYVLGTSYNKIFVAVAGDTVIGYIHGADYENTYFDSLKNIMGLAVLPNYQGFGAGKLLLNAIEGWAKDCGCAGVRLVSGHNRSEAHKFYLHCGYSDRKDQKNFIKYF